MIRQNILIAIRQRSQIIIKKESVHFIVIHQKLLLTSIIRLEGNPITTLIYVTLFFSNNTEDYEVVREWVTFPKETDSIEWVNFHLHHKDHVKVKLKTTNAALNSIINETSGFVVDLTPADLVSLGDGTVLKEDKTFQVCIRFCFKY